MDEKDFENVDSYIPRPRWQVWGARIALVVLVIGIIGWYYFLAHPL